MFELVCVLLTAFLARKTRSFSISMLPVIAFSVLFVFLNRPEDLIITIIAGIPIAVSAEADDIDKPIAGLSVALFLSRLISEIYGLAIAPEAFLAFVIVTLLLGLLRSSIAFYALGLLILLYLVDLEYSWTSTLESLLIVLFLFGLFMPAIKREHQAKYAGKLENALTINAGVKVTLSEGSDVRVTDVGYVVDGKIHIDLRGLGIIRNGPALITGIRLPVRRSSILAKRKRLSELIPLDEVSFGPFSVSELGNVDVITAGPIRIVDKSSGASIVGTSRRLVSRRGRVDFESPEGKVELSENSLFAKTSTGSLRSNDVFEYSGKYGRLKADLKRKAIEGYVYLGDEFIEFSSDDGEIFLNDRPISREEAFRIFSRIRDRLFSKLSEELSERISGYFFSRIFSTSRPRRFARLIAHAITSASSSS